MKDYTKADSINKSANPNKHEDTQTIDLGDGTKVEISTPKMSGWAKFLLICILGPIALMIFGAVITPLLVGFAFFIPALIEGATEAWIMFGVGCAVIGFALYKVIATYLLVRSFADTVHNFKK